MIMRAYFDKEGFFITDKSNWKNSFPVAVIKSEVEDGVIYTFTLFWFCFRIGFEK